MSKTMISLCRTINITTSELASARGVIDGCIRTTSIVTNSGMALAPYSSMNMYVYFNSCT